MADPVSAESIAEAAAAPASASSPDGRSASAHSIPDQIAALQLQQAETEAEGKNAQGGPRSAWNMTRPATAIMPGATRRT
ncbi:hypothetical protein R5W24_004455 [Gemmata sp. JC717]|uniref:hypothetical protein n=1 Tax=Gemmata algarum TaxID=2975278 RepID=UPI0021BADCA1|nr:hypothetical protein [Gemmata algarum]MDY3555313.1 hypothetical protein [Gemmata algarum]